MTPAAKAVAAALLCGAIGALLLLAGARWMAPDVVSGSIGDAGWTGRSRAWFTSRGFQGAEIDLENDRQFSWTSGRARIAIPHLHRGVGHRVTLDINAFRLDDAPLPVVTIAVDGQSAASLQTTVERQLVTVDVPRRAGRGVVITIESSSTFVPGPSDPRVLGAMVNDVALEAVDGHIRPSWAMLGLTALSIAAFVIPLGLTGVPRLPATAIATAATIGIVWLLLLDAAFLGDDVWRFVGIGAGAAALGAVVSGLRSWRPNMIALPEWSAAVGIVVVLSALKLAFFTHPQIAQADAMFQTNRAQLVARGEYFFTSMTPSPGFEFPYAVLLYVTAVWVRPWLPAGLEMADLLRALALAADALVGVALYAVVRRQWQNGPAALLCAALWTLTRAPAMALGHANLTNLFGQGLFGVAIGVLAWMAAGARVSATALVAACVVLTLAFLSHFSTLSTGVLLVAAVAVALGAAGGRDLRRVAFWFAPVLALAVVVSYVTYYSHFTDLYRETFTRIVSRADATTDNSMTATPALKFQRWLTEDQFANDYGLPGMAMFLAAAIGLAWLLRERPRDGLTIVLAAWAIVWAVVSAMGILTSVELRINLAAAPMFVCLATYGLWRLASHSRFGRAVAVTGLAAITAAGARVWLYWLGQL